MTMSVLTETSTAIPRPVPWRALAWVAWRRYRTTLLGILALLGVIAIFLLIRGHQMRDAYAAVQACSPQASAKCGFAFAQFRDAYANTGPLGALLVWLPAVIGAFAGAPLLAREFEFGTFRYVWTQGAGRTRWLVALVVAGTLGVAMLAAALGVVLGWYHYALVAGGIWQRLTPNVFPVTGIAVVGWAMAAFAMGVFIGLLTRRAIPALAVTLAAWTGLAFLASSLRDRYIAPLITTKLQLASSDFSVDQWWTKGGVRIGNAQLDQVLQSVGIQPVDGGNVQAAPGSPAVDPVQYLLQHGYTQLTSYQPDSRYWPFQWIEFGWLTIFSLLLLAASIWLLRRRPA